MNNVPLVQELGSGSVSAFRRYQDFFVGNRTLRSLLKHELIASLASPWPGAAGYWLRRKSFPLVLGSVGRGSLFGRDIVLRNPGAIDLGDGVIVDDLVVLDAKGENSHITLGSRILIGRGGILACHNARIRMGDSISMGPYCVFASRSHIDIGSNVAIGSGVHVLGGGHVSDDPDVPVLDQPRTSAGITIEDNVWIGSGARILDGVTVGHNSIVGACAMLNRDVPPYMVVMGNPARVVQKRIPLVSA